MKDHGRTRRPCQVYCYYQLNAGRTRRVEKSKEKSERPSRSGRQYKESQKRKTKADRRQFGWGDSLLKGNKGLQRSSKKVQ